MGGTVKHDRLQNERGLALVTSLMFLVVLAILAAVAVQGHVFDLGMTMKFRNDRQALYNAEAGINRAIAILRSTSTQAALNGPDGNANAVADNGLLPGVTNPVQYGDGRYAIRILNDEPIWTDTNGIFIIRSTGTSGQSTRTIEAVVSRWPPGIKGAMTGNGTYRLLGTVDVDGRNHRNNGDYDVALAGTGTYGASTKGNTDYTTSNLRIGGTNSLKIDKAPTRPPDPSVVVKGAGWAAIATPDAALGLPEDTLKTIALSGAGGSRYVTPANINVLNGAVLNGVTYVALPDNVEMDLRYTSGKGILVVHSPNSNSTVRAPEDFTGIIIIDDMRNFRELFIGAVITLSAEEANAATGQGDIRYSTEAINEALAPVLAHMPIKKMSWKEQ